MKRQLSLALGRVKREKKKRRGRPARTSGVAHRPREVHRRLPMHVTLRMRPEVWNLRSRRCFGVLERAFYGSLGADGARLAVFSVQGNHIHMLVEARDRAALGYMMQVMGLRMAKGLNRVMNGRRGAVFVERYHSRALRSPKETRAALVYVLQNYKKHRVGEALPRDWIDEEYSSALWFTGWREAVRGSPRLAPVATRAETWLLDRGWREKGGGKLSRLEMPRS